MFSPMIAGLIVCVRRDISLSAVGLRIGRVRWLAVAAVVALPLVGLTLLIAVAVPGVGFDPAANPTPGLGLPSGVLGVVATFGLVLGLGATVNAVFAFGEEFGWRGYLLWELAPWGFWKASAAIGALWGVWHAPVIVAGYNYPSFPVIGVVAMTIACLSFSPVYTYLVIRSESVLAAALLHGVFNGSAGLVIAYAVTDNAVLSELVASPVGVAGVIAFGLAAVGIALSGAPSLTREFAHDTARSA
ncbi:CAAX protease self-immunity [Halopenitus persicus]|uniref:CAAX protease self-immunity n=2 Tax=Halopenitus persicus TaxID=1048396 RepID=A0A1H3MVG0_9EURY|nr:CAAX protease self-immunity [Halopenitus persicus]